MVGRKTDNFTKIIIVIMVVALVVVTTGLFYYLKSNTSYNIDSSAAGISEPHLSGAISIEVDYMDNYEITQAQLDEIEEIFTGYGVNVTLVLDEEVDYRSEMSDDDIDVYYDGYRDRDLDSYILIGSEYSGEDNVLGVIYNAEKIVIFRGSIDSAFDGAYRLTALYYVIAHEIGHAYGAEHSDQSPDVMYPTLSQSKMILYPDPGFYDPDVIAELRD